MGRKKPREGRICFASTFAGVDVHVKLIRENNIPKSTFTNGYTYWDAIPMYNVSEDEKYEIEKKKLKEMCVPVDYISEDEICVVYEWQIKKVL